MGAGETRPTWLAAVLDGVRRGSARANTLEWRPEAAGEEMEPRRAADLRAPAVHRGRKEVAVVVPLSARPGLSADEETSLRHLEHVLGGYDRFLLAPPGVPAERPGYHVCRAPARYFGSMQSHARLLLSPAFYDAFAGYRFVLIYHLDALVLADRLLEWCASGVDYIGAPWLRCAEHPALEHPRVGNGGFSLRRVDACLQVLRSRRLWTDPMAQFRARAAGQPLHVRAAYLARALVKHSHLANGARREMELSLRGMDWFGDDMFFSDSGRHYHPEFRVGTLEEGLRFAWDYDPWQCSQLCGGQLPFGAHAWYKRGNRAFWERHLLV